MNRAEEYVKEWMDGHADLLWLYIDQHPLRLGQAFAAGDNGSANVSDTSPFAKNHLRLLFGRENFEFEDFELSDEQIEEIANNYDSSNDPWASKDSDWIDYASERSPEDKFLLRPDFICISTNLDHPGVCLIDAKRRWFVSDDTIILTLQEVRGLQNLSQLTSMPVWIAVLEFQKGIFDFSNGGYLIPIDALPFFSGKIDNISFEEKDGSSNTEKAWRYRLCDIQEKHSFNRNTGPSFDSNKLFRTV